MSARKPLPVGCNGSIDCPISGHLTATRRGAVTRYAHIPLTAGQSRTLYERRSAERGKSSGR